MRDLSPRPAEGPDADRACHQRGAHDGTGAASQYKTLADAVNAGKTKPRGELRIAEAGKVPSSILAAIAGRRGALHSRIAPLAPSTRFAGPTLTVEVRPVDGLMIRFFEAPAHPYSRKLFDSLPSAARRGEPLAVIRSNVPSPTREIVG